MKIVKLTHPYAVRDVVKEDIVLVLGFFDGVHLGHQEVIEKGRQMARERGLKLALMSFDRNPAALFQPEKAVEALTTLEEKAAILSGLSVDLFYVVTFDQAFAHLSAEAFEKAYMEGLGAKVVVAGFDYRYGHKASGNLETLRAKQPPFEVLIVDKYEEDAQKVSSTRIRQLLKQGQLERANHYLSRPYQTSGLVVHGEARGRTLGFPTANIQLSGDKCLPQEGVYTVAIQVEGTWYGGMASIGRNITFGEHRQVTVEVNIFDFSADIYGQKVRVAWLNRLRGEVKFDGVAGLVAQLHTDQIYSKMLLTWGLWPLEQAHHWGVNAC